MTKNKASQWLFLVMMGPFALGSSCDGASSSEQPDEKGAYRECEDDSECSATQCLCGMCTRVCGKDDDCKDLAADSVCATSSACNVPFPAVCQPEPSREETKTGGSAGESGIAGDRAVGGAPPVQSERVAIAEGCTLLFTALAEDACAQEWYCEETHGGTVHFSTICYSGLDGEDDTVCGCSPYEGYSPRIVDPSEDDRSITGEDFARLDEWSDEGPVYFEQDLDKVRTSETGIDACTRVIDDCIDLVW